MSATVRLRDIVDALEVQSDEFPPFLDCDTGRVEAVSTDSLHLAEELGEDEDPEDPDDEELEVAKRIHFNFPGRFKRLPTKFEIHEWAIMRDFADSIASDRIRADLLDAIHGAGAFRSFKRAVRQHDIEPIWFKFRTAALKQIAIDWCKANRIDWE